jgi:hypothetical protein
MKYNDFPTACGSGTEQEILVLVLITHLLTSPFFQAGRLFFRFPHQVAN